MYFYSEFLIAVSVCNEFIVKFPRKSQEYEFLYSTHKISYYEQNATMQSELAASIKGDICTSFRFSHR